jgi:hypothetical protein
LGARKDLRAILERSQGEDNGKIPEPYRGRSGRHAGRNLTGTKVSATVLTPVKGITNILSLGGVSHPKLFQLNTTDEKHKATSTHHHCCWRKVKRKYRFIAR